MPDTALTLLRRYAEVRGLPAEDVRWLRHALRLARRERSAALLRRVVAGLVRDAALAEWDGTGEPTDWMRHPASGRRRPGGDVGRECVWH